MKTLHTILILVFLFPAYLSLGQTVAYNSSSIPPAGTTAAEAKATAPAFKGGDLALQDYIATHLTYPVKAVRMGLEGTVVISCYINADGTLEEIEVARSVNKVLDQATIQFVSDMPRWIPATINGEPRRVKYQLPITYSLTF